MNQGRSMRNTGGRILRDDTGHRILLADFCTVKHVKSSNRKIGRPFDSWWQLGTIFASINPQGLSKASACEILSIVVGGKYDAMSLKYITSFAV